MTSKRRPQIYIRHPKHKENPNIMSAKPHTFNILLNELQFANLSRSAKSNQCTRAQFIRESIMWRIHMLDNSSPVCADGSRCVCPQMHPIRQLPNTQQDLPDALPFR